MVPSKLGHQDEPVMGQCHLIKVRGKGLLGVTPRRENQPRFLPESKTLFSGAGVDMGTDTSSVRQLWSHPLVNIPPLQAVHTHWATTHNSTSTTQKKPPGGMAFPHAGDEEEDSGDVHDLLVLVSHCHRALVLQGSALSLNWHISKAFFFLNEIFMTGNQVRHSWS